ncbi:MAG TPA: type II toxin-antitoxin system antitoxin SocA domain-containing protein, partial [Bacteroidales bacterium]
MCIGIQVNKDKIGNLIVLLATRLKPLYHTKLIKLLYLIDEEAVKEDGVPVTWLEYKVWQFG